VRQVVLRVQRARCGWCVRASARHNTQRVLLMRLLLWCVAAACAYGLLTSRSTSTCGPAAVLSHRYRRLEGKRSARVCRPLTAGRRATLRGVLTAATGLLVCVTRLLPFAGLGAHAPTWCWPSAALPLPRWCC
jgi:hypothetical protein